MACSCQKEGDSLVCGFSIYYKGALVREYYGKELIREFKKTCKEKKLWEQ